MKYDLWRSEVCPLRMHEDYRIHGTSERMRLENEICKTCTQTDCISKGDL